MLGCSGGKKGGFDLFGAGLGVRGVRVVGIIVVVAWMRSVVVVVTIVVIVAIVIVVGVGFVLVHVEMKRQREEE